MDAKSWMCSGGCGMVHRIPLHGTPSTLELEYKDIGGGGRIALFICPCGESRQVEIVREEASWNLLNS